VKSWNDLKEQIIKRYQPIAQEQLSLSSLLKIRFRNSVQSYNDEFINHLQLLPAFNDPATESIIMGIYLNGITEVSGTTYICTVLKSAIAKKKATTMSELQSIALLAESNLGRDRKASVPYSSSNSTSVRSNNHFTRSSPSYHNRAPHYNNNNHHSNTNHRPVQSPTYSTPAKLNHLESNYVDPYEEQVNADSELNNVQHEDNNQDSRDDGYTIEDQAPSLPTIHDDPNVAPEELFLNAMKFYDKNKKLNPSLTPEELSKRRQNQTCFRCNRTGHFINQCPLLKNQKNF
jgi:hypothetical protein